ncbi:acylphosphatase [Clostridium sp. cel8]|jgi:acylphosphatase|uniref:acylphosphatase n=1 Tax=unclassified Clostridium TaxID=2614128 RepID=UPI0015F3D338|nr:acylphosphatase [Clostridium sp. cel8]MBA5852020.1 acylphosphatase [Clostridium sp. cel8]
MKRYALNVYGMVQGVGFRYTTYSLASKLNLTGWVKNMLDGSVSIEIQGEENNLKYFIQNLKESNRFAHVEKISSREIDISKGESSFKIKF